MRITVVKTGKRQIDEPKFPVDQYGHHHECQMPGRFGRWMRGLKPGAIVRCDMFMRSSQDSAQPSLKYDKYIPICGREWLWTGITWVQSPYAPV